MHVEVNRTDFRDLRVADASPPSLADGEVRLAIERFALTSNNVTYAVAGDMLDYWGFFPTDAGWGRVPVMGLSTVVESRADGIAEGGRYFGFTPMASEHVLAAAPRGRGFRDVGPHRAGHAPTYRDFVSVADEPGFRDDLVDEFLILRGMFTTSWLIDDQLADDAAGEEQTLVTSASSKTSISLAACLQARDHHTIGLTSARNRAFVESVGFYDEVRTYDEIGALDPSTPSAFVDMAGNAEVRAAVHHHFGDALVASLMVGITHWEAPPVVDPVPGPTPTMFFAPGRISLRADTWGAAEFTRRLGADFSRVLDDAPRWLSIDTRTGADGAVSAYAELVDGRSDPSVGLIVVP